LLSHLTDLGLLASPEDGWPSASEVQRSGAPEGIRQVLWRRVGLLSPSARDTLLVAAVAGGEFHAADVRGAMAGEPEDVIVALEEAAANGLITETSGPPGAYRFAHALVRHTIYGSASAWRRAELHWRIAEAIRGAPKPEKRLNDLAYHYQCGLAAGDPAVEDVPNAVEVR
jgi:hypothetical protein